MKLVMMVVFVALVFQTNAASVLKSSAGELQIVAQSKEEVVAVYVLNDGSGVHITSTASNNGTCINITSLEGNEIILARHSDIASASLLRIMGHAIAIRKTSPDGDDDEKEHEWMDYSLPFEVSHHFDTAISQHQFPDHFSHHLNESSVNHTKHSAINMLLSNSKTRVMAEACHALGNAGIYGFENPAALNLYSFVLRYEKFQIEYESNPELFDITSIEARKRRKRSLAVSTSSSKICPSLRGVYKRSSYFSRYFNFNCGDRCPVGSGCLGMCGKSCKSCWYYLCGDCCRHEGCYQHDLCCDKKGFFHWRCLFPFHFSCDSYVCK